MFLYYFVHVRLPFRVVEERIASLRYQGLDDLATGAYHEGQTLQIRVGVGRGRPVLAKRVRVDLGMPRAGDGETTIPLTWVATGAPGLFPRLEGDLVVSSLGESLTQITLRGSYEPPMGVIGRALDRTVLHRVSEASVKAFLDRLATAVGPLALAAGSEGRL